MEALKTSLYEGFEELHVFIDLLNGGFKDACFESVDPEMSTKNC